MSEDPHSTRRYLSPMREDSLSAAMVDCLRTAR